MDFDYSRDIAPLRGQFFQNPSMTDRERRFTRTRFNSEIVPLLEVHDHLNEQARARREDELRYKRSLFELRQAKQAARDERTALQALPTVTAELDKIFSKPGATSLDKAKAVADVTAKYASQISRNPAFEVVLGGYRGRLELEDRDEERIRSEKEADEATKYDRANLMLPSGDVGGVRKIFLEDGRLDPKEDTFLRDSRRIIRSRDKATQKQAAAAQALGQQNAALERRDKAIEEFSTFLTDLRPRTSDALGSESGEGYAPAEGEAAVAPDAKFTWDQRTKVIKGLVQLHGIAEDRVKDLTDQELLALALETSYGRIASPTKASPTAPMWDD